MIYRYVILLFLIFCVGLLPAQDKQKEANVLVKTLDELRSAMQAKDYAKAVQIAEAGGKLPNAEKGYFPYMQGLAQFYLNNLDDSEKNLKELLVAKDSSWLRKARFLLAKIYLKRKNFAAAEKIYAEEANFLHAADRKKEIATIYIQFAEALSRQPAPHELECPPPDYNKAFTLYQRALELKPGGKLSEELTFRLGKTMQLAQNWYQASQNFEEYLKQYDPDWQGWPGKSHVSQATVTGEFREEARYFLGEALLKYGYYLNARQVFEDFLVFLGKSEHAKKQDFRRDALWQITRSYRLPNTERGELAVAVASLRLYLKEFPESLYSVQAAYEIGAAYANQRQTAEAISAWQDFLEGKNYKVLQNVAKEGNQEIPIEAHARLRKETTYNLGRLYFDQKAYAQAIEVWSRYTSQFTDGPHWSASQQGILDAEYQIGEDLIAAKKYEEARATWEKFMAKYPLDVRTSRILYVFGQIKYQLAVSEKEALRLNQPRQSSLAIADLFAQATGEWEKLISKYPSSDEAQAALFMTGRIYEEELKELAKALETYRRVNSGKWYSHAQERIRAMTNKELVLTSERVFRTAETAKVKVQMRNVKSLTMKIYKLNMEEFFRKQHNIQGIENLDIALIEPDKTWEMKLDKYGDYLPMTEEIAIPMEGPGVYAVNVSDGELESTTLTIRSDIDLILKSSRREILVFVENMKENKPAAGVKVLVSDGQKLMAKGETNEQGVFQYKADNIKDAGQISVFADMSGNIASNLLSLSGLEFSQGLAPKGYVFSDRPAYRPGDVVNIRAILREVVDGAFAVPHKAKFVYSVFDPKGRALVHEETTLSDFGTAHKRFALSREAEVGEYRIEFVRAEKSQTFQGTFRVEHLRLEKIRFNLTFPSRVAFRGEKLEGTFAAVYYYGTPLSGKTIRYTLPDGRSFTGETDAKGQLKFTFDTVSMMPGSTLRFSGRLEAEGMETRDEVTLADKGFSIALSSVRTIVLAGEPVEIKLVTKDASGNPTSAQLQVTAYRKVSIQPDPVLAALPWKGQETTASSEVKIAEKSVTTDVATGLARVSFTLENGGNYVFRATGQDRQGNPVGGETTLFISDKEDATKLRIFSDRQHLKIGESVAVQIHSRLDKALALITFEGETILAYRIVPLSSGLNSVEIGIEHKHFPNFQMSVAVMADNRFYQASQEFTVEREMKLEVRLDKAEYLPGETAKATVVATDHLGKPVKGEISLALVDEAVFAMNPETRQPIVAFFQEGAKRMAAMRMETSCTFRYQGKTGKVAKEVLEELRRLTEAERSDEPLALAEPDEEEENGYGERTRDRKELNAPVSQGPLQKQLSRVYKKPMAKKMKNGHYQQALNGKAMAQNDDINAPETSSTESAPPAEPQPLDTARRESDVVGWWAPAIVTGDNGEATIEISMPDKITEWRITLIGCTGETLVGEGKRAVLTRKNFFVDVKLPQLFLEGDTPRVMARVHNLSDYTGPVSLTLEMEMGSKRVVQPKQTTIQAAQTTEFVFDGETIPSALSCEVKVTASVMEKGLQDSIVRQLPVRPWGMEYASHAGGQANSSATALVSLPANKNYSSRWMNIVIGPTMSRTILDLAMDDVVVLRCGYQRPYPSFGSQASDLLACAAALEYASKVRTEAGDYDRLLSRARSMAASLIASQRDDGGWSLTSKDGNPHTVASARSLWALAEAQRYGIKLNEDTISKAVAYLKNAFTQIAHEDDETKALIQYALALVQESDFAYANRLYRQRASMTTSALAYTSLLLSALDKKEMAGELVDILEKKKVAKAKSSRESMWPTTKNSTWTANPVETTALVLLALEATRPTSPLVKEAAQYLLGLRYGYEFSPHHAKGTAVAALARYYLAAQYAQNDYTLEVVVNGAKVQTFRGLDQTPTAVIAVDSKLLVKGENRVELQFAGNGTYTYAVTLYGFSTDLQDINSWSYPYVSSRAYRHSPLEYKGKSIGVTSSSAVHNLELGQVTHVDVNFGTGTDSRNSQHFIVEETIPAGAIVLTGNLSGNYSFYEILPGLIRFYFTPSNGVRSFSYELAGYAPGNYRVLPTIIRDAHNPSLMRIGEPDKMTVMGPGEKSPDKYEMNMSELDTLGRLNFEDGQYKEALSYLTQLNRKSPTYNQRDVARMLLWIYTEKGFYDARRIVDMFEILKEKYPELDIPFERILVVGKAYEHTREFERAYLVFNATIESSFEEEAKVGGVLEDQGEFWGSSDFMRRLWKDYHDSAAVVQAHFGISQALYSKVSRLEEMKNNLRLGAKVRKTKAPTKQEILSETIALLQEFSSFYPESPQTDDAAFSLASAQLALNKFQEVVDISQQARKLYPESNFASSFQYMEALGHFSLHNYGKAIEQAKVVAEGESKDNAYATYILGQVYHAQGNAAEAIAFYRRIQDKFPDAKEAIGYFESRFLRVPEVSKIRPGDKVSFDLEYRNIKEAQLLVYRVDLMKLYLQQKNLSGITKVHLAGIAPVLTELMTLGDGKDYRDMKKSVPLSLEGEGAYLVICRGDDLFTSGLILVTPLNIEVQEDINSRRVRVYMTNLLDNSRPENIHVKVVGSASQQFISGETDLRGIFVADTIQGKVTVIARDKKNRYAFYRGETWLGPTTVETTTTPVQPMPQQQKMEEYDFRSNLEDFNRSIQESNVQKLRVQMRRSNKGVQVDMAK